MRRLNLLLILSFLFTSASMFYAQQYVRKIVTVPHVDSGAIKIDGKMNEAAWNNAAHADVLTNSGSEGFFNKYYAFGDKLTQPDYKAIYGRMLWSKDTLYIFVHIQEVVNDSMVLYFGKPFEADQLFISLSNRLGIEKLEGSYNGSPFAAPDGPYHFFVLGPKVTLNNGDTTKVPPQYRRNPGDTARVFNASDIARWATTIDTTTGTWDVEMAVYSPGVNSQSEIGFNIGGSNGQRKQQFSPGDRTYEYWTWQPSIPNNPYGDPVGADDPGQYNLVTSKYWALLKFQPDPKDSVVRKVVDVPMADSGAIKIDGKADEAAWKNAAHADLLTNSGSESFFNKYYAFGDKLTQPDYKSIYGRMLWSKDTLYLFYHVQEVVNDSMVLYFGKPFEADQVFVSLSDRLGIEKLPGSYNGSPFMAPDGPYHYFILGPKVTLNGGDTVKVPPQYRRGTGDSLVVFKASDISRWATNIDTTTGTWDIEMAIYCPGINSQSQIGFNLGGSNGQRKQQFSPGDRTYEYYTWQPNIPNNPYGDPVGADDPGQYNLVTSKYWALLNFVTKTTGVEDSKLNGGVPSNYNLSQNYPNPFNPSTTIRFDVPKFGPVTLKVYNVVGQLVATLVNNREFAPGSYAVTWNANALASGVYLYSLEAGSIVVTKKMMLLK